MCLCIDIHQDFTKSEPASRGQSNVGTAVSDQLLRHWTLGVVDHSTSGM